MSRRKVIGIVLAAGQSNRMGWENKLTKNWRGRPLVAHVVDAARSSSLSDVVVVTGHQAKLVAEQCGGDVTLVHNPDFATGMASSLRVGIAQAQRLGTDAALILLGDMPLVGSSDVDAIVDAYNGSGTAAIVQATGQGNPGNPVLFDHTLFAELLSLEGDMGARNVVKNHADKRLLVEIGDAAARDFDTPAAFGKSEED